MASRALLATGLALLRQRGPAELPTLCGKLTGPAFAEALAAAGRQQLVQPGPSLLLRRAFASLPKSPPSPPPPSAAASPLDRFRRLFGQGQTGGLFRRLLTTEAAPVGGSNPAWRSEALVPPHANAYQRILLSRWPASCAAGVFVMVVLGGVTRLTRSGLSMTDWKFTFEQYPASEADWVAEFEKYKQSPEFRKVNRSMKLDDFKFIYWMEYVHRMWGRFLGLLFVAPGAYLALRHPGLVTPALLRRMGIIFTLVCTQGLVGWWMVRSGLEEPTNTWDVPRVSPYRLAAHLASAFAIFGALTWTTLDLRQPVSVLAEELRDAPHRGDLARIAGAGRLRPAFYFLAAVYCAAATSGAFVAGIDAGGRKRTRTHPRESGGPVPMRFKLVKNTRPVFGDPSLPHGSSLVSSAPDPPLTRITTCQLTCRPPFAFDAAV